MLQTCDESTEERWIIFNRYQWPPAICIIIVVIHHHYHCILGRARVWNSWHCLLLQEEERCARARSRSVLKPKHSFVRTLVPLQKLLWLDLSVKVQAVLRQHSIASSKGVQHSCFGKISVTLPNSSELVMACFGVWWVVYFKLLGYAGGGLIYLVMYCLEGSEF